MFWQKKTNGAFRCVRLTRDCAFKTPYVLNWRQIKLEWRRSGMPKSIAWLWRTWRRLFHENRLTNEAEVRRWREWVTNGAQKVSGVGLCPIRFHLPFGLLVVMTKAEPLQQGRVNKDQDFLSNGFVSSAEMQAARILIGRNVDTSKADTYGLVDGGLVVIDYGSFVPDSTKV